MTADLPGPRNSWKKALNHAKDVQRTKVQRTVLIRLLLTIVAWMAFAFALGGIFYALESPVELALAAQNAYVEEVAGLRESDWREKTGVGCFGHPIHCESLKDEAQCDGFAIPGRRDESCYWCGDESTCIKGKGSGGGDKKKPPSEAGGGDGGGGGGGGKPPPGGGGGKAKERRLSTSDLTTANEQIDQLKTLLTAVREQCKQAPPTIEEPNWTYAGSLFFAFQVITTVGYGTFAPSTPGGRTITVIMGGIGIAFTGYTLGIFTAAIDSVLDRLYVRCVPARYGKAYAVRFKAAMTSVALVVYLLIAATYAMVQGGWDLGSAIYFVFVTVSTVGLGDLTLPMASIGEVVAQFLIFYPGLALFAEFIALGGEATRAADAAAAQLSSAAIELSKEGLAFGQSEKHRSKASATRSMTVPA